MRDRIKMANKQLNETITEIKESIKKDVELNQSIALITTIPGIGVLTSAVIMAETNGFELIRSTSQLSSYAGFDVKEKESGTSLKENQKYQREETGV
jgi:transposase